MPRALFFMHNYNDFDHMTPVIDSLMMTGRWQCAVVFYPSATLSSVSFEDDWRLEYLRQTHGVTAHHIDDVAPASRKNFRLFKIRNFLTRLCDATSPIGHLFGRDVRGLLPWFLASRSWDHFLAFWLRRVSGVGTQLFERFNPDIVAVDWGKTHNIITPVLERAAQTATPVIELPHGAWTYEGVFSHASQFDPEKLQKRTRLPVTRSSAVVLDNLYKGYRSELQGIERKRMRFLGLARFTPDWLERLATLPRGTARLGSNGRPKLVWFPTWLMACDVDAIDATLDLLERYADRIDIVLKVHTRNPAHEAADYGRRLKPGSGIRLVANEEESFAVTRWADIVLITQSSIVYDAFLLGKPVLYLKYTHDFTCMWETDGVGETVENTGALEALLEKIVDGTYRPTYDSAMIDRYLRLGVTGGQAPDAVLDSYVALFDQAAAGEPLCAGHDLETVEKFWQQQDRQIVQYSASNANADTPCATQAQDGVDHD